LNDQLVVRVVSRWPSWFGMGRSFLQDDVGSDHLARNQVRADTEVLE